MSGAGYYGEVAERGGAEAVAEGGLPVYKYFHLGMDQKDGGTPLCPFDCDCCF